MDFHHSDDRQMLANSIGRYMQQRYAFQERLDIATSETGWSRRHWLDLAELGVAGALIDVEAGGYGGGGFDIAVVFEQLGRSLVVEPFLGTVMAGRILANASGHTALLDEMVAGTALVALAHEEAQNRYALDDIETRAEARGGTWSLTGSKIVIPQLKAADHILVSARIDQDRIGLYQVAREAEGVAVRSYPMIDGGRGGELVLDRAQATLLTDVGLPLLEEAVAAGIVALCWEAVGIMDVLKDATLAYLRVRRQFGVPIGKFQALQHRLATVALEIEQARSAAINAADALQAARLPRERAMSAAKYTIGRVGTLVAEEAI